VLTENRRRIRGKARGFANIVAAEEQEIGARRAEKRQRAIDIVCSNGGSDVRVGHEPDAEWPRFVDPDRNRKVETL